jgi:peptide/nickel transport system ATP-binding protein
MTRPLPPTPRPAARPAALPDVGPEIRPATPGLPVLGGSGEPILRVRDLAVRFDGGRDAVRDVSFDIRAGETLGLVGASGSGKTTIAHAILRLLPGSAHCTGSVSWCGRDLLRLDDVALRAVRGAEIGLVPQDPLTALNPLHRVDRQVAEALRAHDARLRSADALARATTLLASMGIPPPRGAGSGYPFQWSGGMRQRALIAMAVANRPALLIADEPTSALDATTRAAVLALLRGIQRSTGAALLLIAHDMAVIAQLADRVAVMQAGRIVESACVRCIRDRPRTAYAAELVAAAHMHDVAAPHVPGPVVRGVRTAPVLRVEDLSVRHVVRGWRRPAAVLAVDGVSFDVGAGETLAIVGESGSGKSSLARALVRLERPYTGRVLLDGRDLAHLRGAGLRAARAGIQIVFQEQHASLNPRRRAGASIAEPLLVHGRARGSRAAALVAALLEDVGLPPAFADRFPHELSGGERQRVAIARALALQPRLLVLDEPVTALDAITRAALLRLLRGLQERTGVGCVLIAHDLAMVQAVAHRVAVMHAGRFVEVGAAADIFAAPAHEQTRRLLAASFPPQPVTAAPPWGERGPELGRV